MTTSAKLKPATVQAAKHSGATDADEFLNDGDGLYLRLRPNGTKDWLYRYSAEGGKRRKLSLGRYPDVSLAAARELATDQRKTVRTGVDPLAAREAEKEADRLDKLMAAAADAPKTVNDLFGRWLTGYLDKNRKDGGIMTQRQFEQHLFPHIGDIPLVALRRQHIAAALDKIHATGLTRTCGQLLSNLRQMCAFAVTREWLQVDPTLSLKPEAWQGRAREIERFLTLDEIAQLAQVLALSDLPARWQHALWLILATGTRVGETMLAEVSHFTFHANGTGTWFIPAENQKKTNRTPRDFEVHLSPFARAQVEALIALSPVPAEPGYKHWLFPGRDGRPANDKTLAHLIKDRQRGTALKGRKLASREFVLSRGDWTPHDLRRTTSTQMGELRVPVEIIDLCQNHVVGGKNGKVSRIYQRSPRWAEMQEAWLDWGDELLQLKRVAESDIADKIAAKIQADLAREARYEKVKARRE